MDQQLDAQGAEIGPRRDRFGGEPGRRVDEFNLHQPNDGGEEGQQQLIKTQ